MYAALSYVCDRKQRVETDVALHRRVPLHGVGGGFFLCGGEGVSRKQSERRAAGIIHASVGYRLLNLQGSRSAREVAIADADMVVECAEPAPEYRLRVEGLGETKARRDVFVMPVGVFVAPSCEEGVV